MSYASCYAEKTLSPMIAKFVWINTRRIKFKFFFFFFHFSRNSSKIPPSKFFYVNFECFLKVRFLGVVIFWRKNTFCSRNLIIRILILRFSYFLNRNNFFNARTLYRAFPRARNSQSIQNSIFSNGKHFFFEFLDKFLKFE